MPSNKDKENVTIAALTWNMGNKSAPSLAVKEFCQQLSAKPTVIVISTQEELASNGSRLQDLILAELGNEYELVKTPEPQFHTTFAGANNKVSTFLRASFTDNNRVSSAVLVKKPYQLLNAHAHIDYEPGKEKGGNKSIITISGVLMNGDSAMKIAVSGAHLDSNSDKKRRAHMDVYLEREALKSKKDQTFGEIYQQASTFRTFGGDLNERDYLMKDNETKDRIHQTNAKGVGFDVDAKPTQNYNDKDVHGTYGAKYLQNNIQNKQQTDVPDPRDRPHVAKGGNLDRMSFSTGLPTQASTIETQLNEENFKLRGKKWLYHGSDHLPVMRIFTVTPPGNDTKAKIVGEYIKKRLPDMTQDIDELKSVLKPPITKENLSSRIKSVQFHDSTLSSEQFLKHYAGLAPNENSQNIKDALMAKYRQKIYIRESTKTLNQKIDKAIEENDTIFLERSFNVLTKCNEFKNAFLEMKAANETLVDNDEGLIFLQNAEKLVDLMYKYSLSALNLDAPLLLPQEIIDLNDEMNMFIQNQKDSKQFEKCKQASIAVQNTYNAQKPQPSKIEHKKHTREDLMSNHRTKAKRENVPSEKSEPTEPTVPESKRKRYQ
ncbi:MAG: hypothetical protein HYX61_00455 [Gammaproteobacteria bacterium]|nr:hypothetical protein [Gammaproteobacteria bacterium]